MKLTILVAVLSLAACGSDSKNKTDSGVTQDTGNPVDTAQPIDAAIDAPPAPAMITVTGTANEITATGSVPVSGATIAAYRSSDETTPVAMATTNAMGNFTLTITTGGVALVGYIKASKTGLIDTYLYPPQAVASDLAGAPIKMVTMNNFQLLATLAQGNQTTGKGVIAAVVLNGAFPTGTPVAGATITTNPASSPYRYNGTNGFPSSTATATAADGTAYAFNTPPNVTVTLSATKSGTTFLNTVLKARPDVLTTTLVVTP